MSQCHCRRDGLSWQLRRTSAYDDNHIRIAYRMRMLRVEGVRQRLYVKESTQLRQPSMPNSHIHRCCHCLSNNEKRHVPAVDTSMRSDVSVELSTASHSVHTVSIAATRPSRWSATRTISDAAPHSRQCRPLTRIEYIHYGNNKQKAPQFGILKYSTIHPILLRDILFKL